LENDGSISPVKEEAEETENEEWFLTEMSSRF
jgi:hypothetical protein